MRAKRWSALLLSGVMAASMLTGCGMNKNETVATFDETEVPLGVANFAARFLQATYDDFYVAYFGEDVWSSDLYNNGTTMQDNIKDSVMQSLFDMYTLEAHMAEYDVELTEDDKAEIADTAAAFIADNSKDALDALGLGSGSKKVDARDAIIYYNGVKYTGDSNTMTINGMTITAKAKTDTAVNVEVSADTDAAYNNVKKFVKAYNELIEEMNKYYSEKDAGYDALTEDERSKLSDTQIEKWEEKAKQGLLRRDTTLQTLLSDMRTMLNKGVQVTLADGSTKTMSLASIGIVTGDYTENGKLHIMGDEEDENYASQENKLRAALEGNDNLVSQIIGGTTENKGVGTQMYDYLRKSMTRIEGVRSTQTFYNDKTMDSEIDDYDDEIDKWEEKLQALEDKYYNQFAKMESAMAKMQSQQSYLSSLFGG